MDASEVEQLIVRTLTELEHPRIKQVQTFNQRSGSERTGVHVVDTDGSEGYIQVVS